MAMEVPPTQPYFYFPSMSYYEPTNFLPVKIIICQNWSHADWSKISLCRQTGVRNGLFQAVMPHETGIVLSWFLKIKEYWFLKYSLYEKKH